MNEKSPFDTLVIPLFLGMLFAALVLIYQCYVYLSTGFWQSLSIIDLLGYLDMNWANVPTTWLGVHKILKTIPLSITLLIIGFLPLIIWLYRDDSKQN